MTKKVLSSVTAVLLAVIMMGSLMVSCGEDTDSGTKADNAVKTTEKKTEAAKEEDTKKAEEKTETAKDEKTEEEKTEEEKTEEEKKEAAADQQLKGSIAAAGSSAIMPLAEAAADKFMEMHPDLLITISGGGSGAGLKQLVDGSIDIGNSDVSAESKLPAEDAEGLVDNRVCVVGMGCVVNEVLYEDIKDLSREDLIKVFTGEYKNWKELGGPDSEIILVTRALTSGTRALFKEFALNGNEESSEKAIESDNTGSLLQAVADNEGAIAYAALPYLQNNEKVKAISIDGVEPTLENIYSGEYEIWGYEHMYTHPDVVPEAQAFIDYMMSEAFAPVIEENGYGAISKMTVER